MTTTGTRAHVEVDSRRCQGHGRCYSLYPELFEPDDLGLGSATTDPVPAKRAVAAAADCPESAIVVELFD